MGAGTAPTTAPSTTTATGMPPTYRAPTPPNAPALVRKSQRSGHVRLDYQLGKDSARCDSEALFRKIFASELKEPDPFVPIGSVDAVVTVRLEHDSPGFLGTIELSAVDGTVVLHDAFVERTCTDAADRVMIELMLRVFPATEPPPPPQAPPPTEGREHCQSEAIVTALRALRGRLDAQEEKNEEQEEKIRALERALAEERKRKMDLTFALSAGALITANLTSNVGPGVWLGGDVRSGPLSLGLEVRGVLPSPVFLKPYDFDVSQVVALITPSGRYGVLFGCVVAGAGVEIHEDSNLQGFHGPASQSGPVLQIGGRLGAEYFLGEGPLAREPGAKSCTPRRIPMPAMILATAPC